MLANYLYHRLFDGGNSVKEIVELSSTSDTSLEPLENDDTCSVEQILKPSGQHDSWDHRTRAGTPHPRITVSTRSYLDTLRHTTAYCKYYIIITRHLESGWDRFSFLFILLNRLLFRRFHPSEGYQCATSQSVGSQRWEGRSLTCFVRQCPLSTSLTYTQHHCADH